VSPAALTSAALRRQRVGRPGPARAFALVGFAFSLSVSRDWKKAFPYPKYLSVLRKKKTTCHPNLSAGPSVRGCVERAAEMGFVLNTVEILYLLKQGQNNEHSSVNELDELPRCGKPLGCAGPALVALRILQQVGFSRREAMGPLYHSTSVGKIWYIII